MNSILDLNETPNLYSNDEAFSNLNLGQNFNNNNNNSIIEDDLSYNYCIQQNNLLSSNRQNQEDNNISNQIAIFNQSLMPKEETQTNNKFPNDNQSEIVGKSQIYLINAIVKNKEISFNKKAIFGIFSPINSQNKSTNYKSQISFYNNKKKYKKKHPDGKFGRITKANKAKGKKGKHTKNNVDNFKIKLFTHCIKNIDKVINSLSNQYKIKLIKPTITPQMGKKKNENDLKIISKKNIQEIYLTSKPKRHSANYAEKTKKDIEMIIQKEEENPKEKEKQLKIIFNKTLREFIIMFVNDNTYLEGCVKPLEEFITFEGEFTDINPKRKAKIKKKLLDLLE